MTPTERRAIPADKLARDFGVSLSEFADDVVSRLSKLSAEQVVATPAERCRESCAAVWAGTLSALQGSSLTEPERAAMTPLLLNVLIPFWKKHCASEDDIPAMLSARSAVYLKARDPVHQIKTAANIVNALLDTLGVSNNVRQAVAKDLTAMFVHRILGDVHRMNDVRARFGIELAVVAALSASTLVDMAISYEPVMRFIRHL
jgi:hypothetical protein